MSVDVNTSGHLHDDFLRLLFLHAHREAGPLTGELPGVLCLESGLSGELPGELPISIQQIRPLF